MTGLEGQRTAALKTLDGIASNNTAGVFDNLSTVADRPDLPRIESGERQPGLVPGRLDHAGHRRPDRRVGAQANLLDAGARLDVAGAIGVRLAMESNNLKIDVQGQ